MVFTGILQASGIQCSDPMGPEEVLVNVAYTEETDLTLWLKNELEYKYGVTMDFSKAVVRFTPTNNSIETILEPEMDFITITPKETPYEATEIR